MGSLASVRRFQNTEGPTPDQSGGGLCRARAEVRAAPTFVSDLTDQALPTDGTALTIGIDGFDEDGDPLTITAVSDDPNLSVLVPQGNRFARINYVESDGTTPRLAAKSPGTRAWSDVGGLDEHGEPQGFGRVLRSRVVSRHAGPAAVSFA